jgi:putative heme-binding domain-containing protein
MHRILASACLLVTIPTIAAQTGGSPPKLSQKLAQEPLADLAKAARERGDAARGAALFFQPFLTCAKCHDSQLGTQLGPDLTKLGKSETPEYLIESILAPSKVIKKGYEPVAIALHDGRTITGHVVEEANGSVTIVDPAAGGKRVMLPNVDIASRTKCQHSLMPDGLVDLLSDRQQFLDLAKYIIEIAEHGPNRAKELRPVQTAVIIPEYEKQIDHAGLIRALDDRARRRGEAIYARVCANCHGTKDAPGSMPNSLRFASDSFKNGSDPYSLYQTLTQGYGMMAPQTWMVPRQKYDVIHYLREEFLKPHNAKQFVPADERYLANLPRGQTFGPEPTNLEPWITMDYGPSLMNTYEVPGSVLNIAYKGIAVRLDSGPGGVSRGNRWALFDHDTLRLAATWTGSGFIDWKGIHFNGQHQVSPKIVGDITVSIPNGPGWANPMTGSMIDPRMEGRDGRRYGPLPRDWAKYKGSYQYGDQTIISYSLGAANVLESFGAETDHDQPGVGIFSRTLEIDAAPRELRARIAPASVAVRLVGDSRVTLVHDPDFTFLKVPAASDPIRVKVLMANCSADALTHYAKNSSPPPRPLQPLTQGGPRRWPNHLHTPTAIGKSDGPFAVDTFALPENNPWNAQLRLTGFDFFPDGDRAAICTWDGDVWMVTGFLTPENGLSWQRIASGLFQPLGLKIRDGQIFVSCRDQIVRLHDLNGDGEADYYECFNNDHQVTDHFHEFAMGLQTDAAGNFYYAKSGRHALPALVPHHGTLLKVDRDGANTEILATGFRAANGVCLNPDGTFFVTDQEGFWTPKNRINRVERGGFYGNMWAYTDIMDTSDAAMKPPLCWITNDFDRSPAELVWVTSEKWGPLHGSLLNTSYGHGKIYIVPFELINGQAQGGMCALPLPPFATGIMRPRFHPTDGQLYICGMFAWAGNQTQPGGFYRVRYTGPPADLPCGLKVRSAGIDVTFSEPLDAMNVADVRNYEIKTWNLKRSQNYGSKHLDERTLSVVQASLLPDGKTVRLDIAGIAPTPGMEIQYRLKGTDGRAIIGVIHNTINALPNRDEPKVGQAIPVKQQPAEPAKPSSRTEKNIEGWTIRVDDRLLAGPNEALGTRALRFLEGKLSDIKAVMPKDKLDKLQSVVIVLDLTHGRLGPMQYHPSAAWLTANGYSPDLAKCVHIPRAADLATKRNINEQPWVILHELAHAYHDQVLGFDEPRIREAYEKYKKSRRGETSLLYNGKRVRHYALTDPKEFFAEMTEAYFGVNDFFPFNRAELQETEPEIYQLIKDVWETPFTKAAPGAP